MGFNSGFKGLTYMCVGIHVKDRLLLFDLVKFEFSRRIFEKYSNIKFHENPFSGSRVVPCGRTERLKTWRI